MKKTKRFLKRQITAQGERVDVWEAIQSRLEHAPAAGTALYDTPYTIGSAAPPARRRRLPRILAAAAAVAVVAVSALIVWQLQGPNGVWPPFIDPSGRSQPHSQTLGTSTQSPATGEIMIVFRKPSYGESTDSFIVKDPETIDKLNGFRKNGVFRKPNYDELLLGLCEYWVVYSDTDVVGLYSGVDYGNVDKQIEAVGNVMILPAGMSAYVQSLIQNHVGTTTQSPAPDHSPLDGLPFVSLSLCANADGQLSAQQRLIQGESLDAIVSHLQAAPWRAVDDRDGDQTSVTYRALFFELRDGRILAVNYSDPKRISSMFGVADVGIIEKHDGVYSSHRLDPDSRYEFTRYVVPTDLLEYFDGLYQMKY